MIKKYYRYIIWFVLALCLLVGLNLVAYATPTNPLKVSGKPVNEIAVDLSGEGGTPGYDTNENYTLTVTDSSKKGGFLNLQTLYTKRTATLTFTNNYAGWIEIRYSTTQTNSTGSCTVSSVDGCTIENGVIHMNASGSFKMVVVSSDNSSTKDAKDTSNTATFTISALTYQPLTPEINFVQGEHGTFTVKDKDGNTVTDKGESSSYTLTATPASGYEFSHWTFTKDGESKETPLVGLGATATYTASVKGTISCVFVPADTAKYKVDGVEYACLDAAISATGGSGTIVLTRSGKVYGTNGLNEFNIPNGVTLVLPYAKDQNYVQPASAAHPYANYTQTGTYHAQPGAVTGAYLELTIPSGTTVKNNGIISVGGTLGGNAAMSGAHSNLKVDGRLELGSSTSILSAVGYVYGSGSVVANGSGAHIYQPLSLLRNGSWGWSVGCTGSTFSGLVAIMNPGMGTYPSDGSDGFNPSPRFSTQAIQCRLEMKYNDIMHGYADQYCEKHYNCTVLLIGNDAKNALIALHSGATLTSTYDSTKTSSTYTNVGKLTLEITGGATQGNISLSQNGMGISLNSWPFPVPYNYDVILKNGTYNLQFDLNLLPGAGLKVDSGATLNVPKDIHLAVFTGVKDHSTFGVHESGGSSATTSYNSGNPASPRYPGNGTLTTVSTLNGVSAGSKTANFIVDGTLDVKSGGYFGGIVQTNGGGKVIMNGKTDRFTRQIGLTGKCNDMDSQKWYFAGETIYELYPQYFDETGTLQTMESGKVYTAANATTNAIESFTFDLYTSSADVSVKTTHSETINATATGQWHTHVYTSEVTKQPTCTEAGVKTFTCGTCGDTYTEGVAATGHSHNAVVTAPTCTEAGYTTYTCSCGDTYTADVVDALGHKYDSVYTEPTFEADGYTTHTCSVCGNNYVVTDKSTMLTAVAQIGEQKYETLSEALAVGGSVKLLENIDTDAAFVVSNTVTLNLNGFNVKSTEKDTVGDGVFHVVAGGNLTIEGTGVINAVGGSEYCMAIWADGGKVTINGGTYTNVGAGADNQYDLIYVKNGGEVVINGGTFICQTPAWTLNSHDTVKGTITVHGGQFHNFNPYNNAAEGANTNFVAEGKHASANAEGVYTIHDCTTETVAENEVGATCTADGSCDNVTYCTACDAELKRETVTIPATGHSMGDWIVDTAATCTEAGSKHKECANCDREESEVISALGHDMVAVDGKDATCTEDGYTAYTDCSRCDHVEGKEVIPATGHSMGEWIVDTAATCTKAGSKHKECANCDHEESEVIPALGHDMIDVEGKDATCTEDGYTAYTDCSRCDHVEGKTVISATGHNAGAPVVENRIEATETADGSYDNVIYCTVCGSELSRETVTIPATGVQPEEPELNPVVDMSVTKATITAPEGGWKLGENTFTVSCDIACVVMRKDADGEYHRLTATGSGDTYSFTANLESADDQIIVAIKGDISGEGEVNMMDQLCMDYLTANPSHSMHMTLDDIIDALGLNLDADALMLIADLRQDGELDMMDQLYMDYATANASFYIALEWDI